MGIADDHQALLDDWLERKEAMKAQHDDFMSTGSCRGWISYMPNHRMPMGLRYTKTERIKSYMTTVQHCEATASYYGALSVQAALKLDEWQARFWGKLATQNAHRADYYRDAIRGLEEISGDD